MSHLLHRPIVANASLRSVQLRHLASLQGYFRTGIDDVSQHDRLRRFLKRQWAWASFTLLFAAGVAAIAGAILVVFAWNGVGL